MTLVDNFSRINKNNGLMNKFRKKGKDKNKKKQYALKLHKPDHENGGPYYRAAVNEGKVASSYKHRHLTKFIESFDTFLEGRKFHVIVLSFYNLGTLAKYMKEHPCTRENLD